MFCSSTQAQIVGRFYYNDQWFLTKKDSLVYFRISLFDTTNYVFAGAVKDYTKDGKLKMTGVYKGGLKDGEFNFYYTNGKVESVGNFLSNARVGTWKYFYSNGNSKQEIEFLSGGAIKIIYYNDSSGQVLLKDGNGFWREEYEEPGVSQFVVNEGNLKNYKKDGEWVCHLEDGLILFREKYRNGKFDKGTNFDKSGKKVNDYNQPAQNTLLIPYKFENTERFYFVKSLQLRDYPFLKRFFASKLLIQKGDNPEIFGEVEESASPEGGMQAFYRVVGEVMNYPKEAWKFGIEGRVFVEFVINSDGSLSDFRVIKGIGGGCDEEAIRAIQASNKTVKWKPGTQRGIPVKQRYTLPIIFKLAR
jgi:TonB family protein